MAKNWTVAEAVEAISKGDKEAIKDLGKRFPNLTVAIAKMGENAGALEIINALPSHVTARKVEAILKGDEDEEVETDAEVEDGDEDEDTAEEKPAKKDKKEAAKERARKRREARKAAKAKEVAEDDEDEEDEADDEETAENPYEGMTAVELFKLCKKRGISAQPKKKAAEYIELLKAADEPAEDEDDEEEDWEEEEEKPAKKSAGKKAAKEPKAKAKKAAADDEWDI